MWYSQMFSTDGRAYLPWLARQVKQSGVGVGEGIVQKKIDRLDSLMKNFDVVNYIGVGAMELVNDCSLLPSFGQIVPLAAPWMKHFVGMLHPGAEEKYSMIIPRVNDGVLGDVALCERTSAVSDAELSDSLVADAVRLVPCTSRGTRMEE